MMLLVIVLALALLVLILAGLTRRVTASRRRQAEAVGTFGFALEHAADAILVLDPSHTIVSWNRGAEETFGFTTGEIVGSPYATLVPDGREESELKAPLAPGGTVKDFRTRRLRRNGDALEVSLTRSRVPAGEGAEIRLVEILRDITETRRLEEDLLRSEKMAAVGKISSKVVHEIRNPLASINLNVDLLADSIKAAANQEDPEALEVLGIIKREIRRLSQITEEYLQFSRLPRTAFGSERVNDILVELADFVRPSITRKGIGLVLNLDESDPEAVCDSTLLRQALLNLLLNAMDATETGQGRIQMGTRALPEGVEISVEDNGRGIAEELIQRIFEPFYTTKKDGTGLGLALVRRAVDEHGGQIRCHSVPGKGTTFRVLIPNRPAAAAGEEGPGLPPS
jgi:PAS domain S-box-containing protein